MTKTAATKRANERVEFGDWQTPLDLAKEVVEIVRRRTPDLASVLEPTCGQGAFLRAAAAAFPTATLLGFDVSESYVREARARVPNSRATVEVADFFKVRWEQILKSLPEPILVIGNPPWVTNSALGVLDGANLPRKSNFKGHSGLDAMTGKSNFDISEWMLIRMIEAVHARRFTLAMLCKASVARRVMERVAFQGWKLEGDTRAIDARLHFAAAVDAVLLTVWGDGRSDCGRHELRWPVYSSLSAESAARSMGVVEGKTCSDVEAYLKTRQLEGDSEIQWRSGVKHDCSKVMELKVSEDALINGLGESVHLERDYVFPLLKGSDLANGRVVVRRRVIVTQRKLGEDTQAIRTRAPCLWQYLEEHRANFEARKSSIYREQPPFAIFGVGDYSFAPYKVAICGFYKRLVFTVVRPVDGQPVMVDDTAYFLPCSSEEEAQVLSLALNGTRASEFFRARVFWDAKRPISKALLQALSLEALLRAEGLVPPSKLVRLQQQMLAF